ncbi:MAG: glucose 1-dehydrogenase [Planctomycetota bacterium]|jgi:NAD(P)-dependent dehydrogenase (short-subunit alcohol dehydrogenase family)|nr:glucose 1-dehydrogenase [Planctomycetota bacterium]
MRFANKSVIVTGASIGMGRETAKRFAAEGAAVLVNYAKAEKDARQTADDIVKAGGRAALCQGDVSKESDAKKIVATAVGEFGKLDILINNAGVTSFIPFQDLDAAGPDVWERLYATNVVGSFLCARAAAAEMRKTGGGVIVNNASIAGQRANGSSIPYCCSKAALIHLTHCLASTLGPDIRVNSVSPGVIDDTRWNAGRSNFDAAKAHASGVEQSLLKRTGKAGDIAAAILFLASDEASFCTGIDLLVDGGRSYKI